MGLKVKGARVPGQAAERKRQLKQTVTEGREADGIQATAADPAQTQA